MLFLLTYCLSGIVFISVSLFKRKIMTLLLVIYLKTKGMKTNWKKIALYILRLMELIITGAVGGALTQL